MTLGGAWTLREIRSFWGGEALERCIHSQCHVMHSHCKGLLTMVAVIRSFVDRVVRAFSPCCVTQSSITLVQECTCSCVWDMGGFKQVPAFIETSIVSCTAGSVQSTCLWRNMVSAVPQYRTSCRHWTRNSSHHIWQPAHMGSCRIQCAAGVQGV